MNIQILKDIDIFGAPRHLVTVDGVSRPVDLSSLNGRVITWNGISGNLMLADLTTQPISDIAPYQAFIDAWHAQTPVVAPLSLADLKDSKRTDIRLAYEAACNAKVLALSVLWDGGFDSAIKLDAAMRLNQTAGLTTVTFFDSNNEPHVYSFEDALIVIFKVAVNYQVKLANKQFYFKQIFDASLPEDIASIVWVDVD